MFQSFVAQSLLAATVQLHGPQQRLCGSESSCLYCAQSGGLLVRMGSKIGGKVQSRFLLKFCRAVGSRELQLLLRRVLAMLFQSLEAVGKMLEAAEAAAEEDYATEAF